jgi:hypothetical protein
MNLTVGSFVTLDGVMQAPGGRDEDRSGGFVHGGWMVPFADDMLERVMVDWIRRADGLLLGRKTYEIFAALYHLAIVAVLAWGLAVGWRARVAA